MHGEAARVPREAMVSATPRASQSLLADGAQVEMGAARAEGDGATLVYLGSHPEVHLDARTEPPKREGGREQASVCAQESGRGNRPLDVTKR